MGNHSTSNASCKPYKRAEDASLDMKQLLTRSDQLVEEFLVQRENFRIQFNNHILKPEFQSAKSDLEQINNYYQENQSYLIKKMVQLVLKGYIELINNKVLQCSQLLEMTKSVVERIDISKEIIANSYEDEVQIQNYREDLCQNLKILEQILFQYIDYKVLRENIVMKQQKENNQECDQRNHEISLNTISTCFTIPNKN